MSAWKHGLAVGLFASLVAVPAQAQTGKWGGGVHFGLMKPGAIAENRGNEVKVDSELSYGGGLEYWFGRVGLRGDFSYMENTFEPDGQGEPTSIGVGEPAVYFADASLMFRLTRPEPGKKFSPFLSLGAGRVWWDPNDPGSGSNDNPGFVDYVPADVQINTRTIGNYSVTGGIGADWFVLDNAAIRFEVKDHFVRSPYLRLSQPDVHHDWHHNVNFSTGLQLFLGGGVREPGFVARTEPTPEPAPARPAPAPAPQPRPAPAPEPRFENISMCVVGDNGRLMTVNAVRNLDTRALLVDRNGNRVAFETAYPVREPLYVRSSTWYVSDRPLIVDIDAAAGTENRVEFVRFGATSTLPMSELTWVGNVNGTPLYVRNADYNNIRNDLTAHINMGHSDLGMILTADRELAESFGEIETFYVPVETGCVFQPVSSTLIVRRTRG